MYWPVVNTLELSFFQWNLLPNIPRRPVGLANYQNVLTLAEMGRALANTGIYIAALLPFSVGLPLAVSILVADIGGRWRRIYRAILFLPVLMAPVVVAAVWRWILHPTHGVLNVALQQIFGVEPIAFLRDSAIAIWTIVGITGWQFLGFSVLIFSAGLANINRDYVEAAQLDGASRTQVVRHITLPLLSPTILFMVLLTVIHSAQWTFPLINVLTGGGPLNATTNVYFLLWEFGFRSFNVGFSSAAAVLFFVAFGLVAWVFTWLTDRYSFYDA
jgi:multiple sugar transport system permease protein